jgi:glutamate formiminotransferase
MTLLAPVNVSEGRDRAALDAIARAFAAGGARVLDVHADPDHHRAVLTLAGEPGALAHAIAHGAREVLARLDLTRHEGVHPHVGALDVVPLVHVTPQERGAACAEALVAADELGRAGIPVFLYGALAGGRTRAELRRGGLDALIARGTPPDFGPPTIERRHGATLVAARPPLVAFNLEVDATLAQASDIAAAIREGGPEGLPGVRALGLQLATTDTVQVSTNVEDPGAVPLARLLQAVERHAPVTGAELVGLAPRRALAGWPERLEIRNLRTVEDALSS